MGEAAAVVGTVRGRRGSWLWSRPEANRRQSDLDEWKREEFFDVLMMQADEARRRVREGTKWQGMPLPEQPPRSHMSPLQPPATPIFDDVFQATPIFDDVAIPPSPFRPGFGRDPPTTPPTRPEGSRLLKNAGNAHVLSGQT